MTRQFNGKSLIDECGVRSWDTSSTFREVIIAEANEIQNDIASLLPNDYWKFNLKNQILWFNKYIKKI